MNGLINLIPEPDSLPVAPVWFMVFSYLTYYLHLISTGVLFGISVQAVLAFFRGKKDPRWQGLGETMARMLPFAFAFAVNLGIAPLLFLQVLYGNFFYTASIILGIPWLFIFVLLIIAYYMAYWLVFKKYPDFKFKILFSVLITLTLSWIAFVLVNINTLMMVPQNWNMYFNRLNGMNLNMSEATLIPRFIYYIFLFLSIGGLFTALFYKIQNRKKESAIGFHFGSLISGFFCLLSAPAFFLFLSRLPTEVIGTFLKENLFWGLLSMIFFAGLFLTSFLSFKRKILPAAVLLAINLIVFVFIRNQIRFLFLKPFAEKISTLGKNPQYEVMILFIMVFIGGFGYVFWLLKKVWGESLNFKK
jgi:hypothetical protein